MYDIVSANSLMGNQWFNITLLLVAVLRVYLEIIKFDFFALPLTKGIFKTKEEAHKFHRHGLYMSLGSIILSAPFTLFS